MTRFLAAAAFAAAFVPAAASAATYSAKPVSAVAAKRVVVGDTIWACGPAACRGSNANSRPLVLCQGLAKKAGRLESFIVDGRALEAADLDKCNGAARQGGAPALARVN